MRQSSKNRGKLRIAAIAAITAMVLGGCASSSPKDTYGLSLPHVDGGAMKRGRQLLIADPVALKTLDSENIVIRVGSQEYQYLNDSQWSDKLPKLVQLKLAQAFAAWDYSDCDDEVKQDWEKLKEALEDGWVQKRIRGALKRKA